MDVDIRHYELFLKLMDNLLLQEAREFENNTPRPRGPRKPRPRPKPNDGCSNLLCRCNLIFC